ncbi:hypothetical protein [Vibrio splendidus]|nr:hypothetical protein [Vibrio splendidus]
MQNEVAAFLDVLIIVFITGRVPRLGTIAALKTDINLINKCIKSIPTMV